MGLLDILKKVKNWNDSLTEERTDSNNQILQETAMEKIKDYWPYGTNEVVAFIDTSDSDVEVDAEVVYLKMTAETLEDYTLTLIDAFHFPKSWQAFFSNGSFILKNKNGIIEVIEKKIHLEDRTINFDPNDENYKKFKALYDKGNSLPTFEMFSIEDIEAFKSGRISENALMNVCTKHEFTFTENKVLSKGINVGKWLQQAFFNDNSDPLRTELFYDALANSYSRFFNRYLVYDFVEYLNNRLKEIRDKIKNGEVESVETIIKWGIEDVGIYKNEDGEFLCNSQFSKIIKEAELIYGFFNPLVENSTLPIRMSNISSKNDAVLYAFSIEYSDFQTILLLGGISSVMISLVVANDGKAEICLRDPLREEINEKFFTVDLIN